MATLDEILNLDSMSQISNSKKSGAVARRVCVCVCRGGGGIFRHQFPCNTTVFTGQYPDNNNWQLRRDSQIRPSKTRISRITKMVPSPPLGP